MSNKCSKIYMSIAGIVFILISLLLTGVATNISGHGIIAFIIAGIVLSILVVIFAFNSDKYYD